MGMEVRWPFLLNTDSSQAYSFQQNTCPKTFDLRDKATREMRDKGIVKANKIHRDLNVSDMLTHCLTRKQFDGHLSRAQTLRNYNSKRECVFHLVYSVALCPYKCY